jgi:hypothetical protein
MSTQPYPRSLSDTPSSNDTTDSRETPRATRSSEVNDRRKTPHIQEIPVHQTGESEQENWISKNIHALLAFGIMAMTFALYTVVIIGGNKEGFLKPETKDIVIYILGALTTVATQVVSYYFGSSSGSADKSRAINALAKK